MVADLVDALQNPDLGSTVFAPTNDAFTALNSLNLPSANTVTLFRDPDWQPHLQDFLFYHLLGGSQVLAADVTDGLTVTMLNGEDVTFSVSQEDGTVSLNSGATVVTADVSASNGQFNVLGWQLRNHELVS
jgi:transforming growth factor-beta-induced protein